MWMFRQQQRRASRTWFRRNYAFVLTLVAAGVFMYGVSLSLKNLFNNSKVMQLPTCASRFEALGMPNFEDEPSTAPGLNPYIMRRHAVYALMGEDVHRKGLRVGGVITQGLQQSDLFQFKRSLSDGSQTLRTFRGRIFSTDQPNALHIMPVLHELDVPVRAMILPVLDLTVAAQISATVRQLLLPVLPEGSVWFQDDQLYHATVYHASSHLHPVAAEPEEVEAETSSIANVASTNCPVEAILERVVLTSSGVMVACWQATSAGSEPALLREALKRALPNAPAHEAQMVKEPAILHTTIARLLQPPRSSSSSSSSSNADGSTEHGQDARGSLSKGDSELLSSYGRNNGMGTSSSSSSGGSNSGSGTTMHGDSLSNRNSRGSIGENYSLNNRGRRDLLELGQAEAAAPAGTMELGLNAAEAVRAVDAVSRALCGIKVSFNELWFVEEQDLLALALRGRFIKHRLPLQCPEFH